MRSREKPKVRLYIQDGPTIEGVLASSPSRRRRTFVLWAPKVIVADGEPDVAVSGHVEVLSERVLWYQVLA